MNNGDRMQQDLIIFVVGNSRSGTTMMGRILGRHPDVFTFGELHFFGQLWSASDRERILSNDEARSLLMRLLSIQRNGYLREGNPRRFSEDATSILNTIPNKTALRSVDLFKAFLDSEARHATKLIACDQTPRNVYYIRDILELLPEARIVNMVRDPRDVLLSQKKKWKRRFLGGKYIPLTEAFRAWINYHPITIAKMWNAAIQSAHLFKDHDRFFQLRFEDLIEVPEESVRNLCHFLGIEFRDDMLNVPQVGSSTGNDHPDKKGINRQAAGRWQKGGLSKAETYVCNHITHDSMQLHGYKPADMNMPLAGTLLSYLLFPFKIGIAFLLNIHRMRNIRDTIKRRLG